MLPFLKKTKEASVSAAPQTIVRESDHEEELEHEPLDVIAQELVDAVHKKDAKLVADCLHAAFEILDAMPHVEGEHITEEDEE
jgi:hypothetical protein